MRNLRALDCYRQSLGVAAVGRNFGAGETNAYEGAFRVGKMQVIACSGDGWDHVSVSLPDRCPTWQEMEKVKRMFFKDDETAMQLHVPPARHINIHPNVLHLWRPHDVAIPMPPEAMV